MALYTGGWLDEAVEEVRFCTDDPAVDAKYTDDRLIKHFLEPAWVEVYNALAMVQDNPIVVRHQITLVTGQQFYTLPPQIRRVMRVGRMNTTRGFITHDWIPRSDFHPLGPGWQINGNQLEVRPFPADLSAQNNTLDIWYIPTGDVRIHEGEGLLVDSSNSPTERVFDLGATPNAGALDRRVNAYGGSYLNILDAGTGSAQTLAGQYTYLIEAYDPVTRRATLRRDWDGEIAGIDTSVVADRALRYEIVPPLGRAASSAVGWRAAIKMLKIKGMTRVKDEQMEREFRNSLKALRDHVQSVSGRLKPHMETDAVGRPDHDTMLVGWEVL